MSEPDYRLAQCFASVFPTLSDKEIRSSILIRLFDLDSLSVVTLVTLIGQEFNVNIEVSDLLEMGSFEAIVCFLENRNGSEVPQVG